LSQKFLKNNKNMSKLLVVDASIIHAAGPSSTQCRKALEDILSICHHVIITIKIKAEWDRHFTNYSLNWYHDMVSRRKTEIKTGTELTELEKKLDTIEMDEGIREIIRKDLLLIEAACSADQIIISCDEHFKKHFNNFRDQLDFHNEIFWINPTQQEISTIT